MNLPYFIAKRISDPKQGNFSSTIQKVAVASVAIGLAVMIGAYMILGGFQNTITDKIFSFSGHIQITKFSFSNSVEEDPIKLEQEGMQAIIKNSHVSHIQEYAHKPVLLSKDDEVYGIVVKGVAESFNLDFFEKYLVEGRFINFNDSVFSPEILISKEVAEDMILKVGDKVVAHIIQDPPRVRQLTVVGIYNTELDDFDKKIILGDIKMIRGLNGWEAGQVGGYEVFVNDFSKLEEANNELADLVDIDQTTDMVPEKFVQIFEWLALLNQNNYIFLALILFVACFNIVSVLFILIMERTQMIGMFKAIGATDSLIRKVFSYNGIRLVIKGAVLGNIIAITFGAVQYYFRPISLDPVHYYMAYVPIDWNWSVILGLNAMVIALIAITIFLPTALISRVRPVQAIRFD